MTNLEFWQAAYLAVLASGSEPKIANQCAATALEHYLLVKERLEMD